ncbi:MAG TPA: helix-turn-helix domain-containing protein, partial [Polyangiaceae bacterium]
MDPALSTAARALATGDVLSALRIVALRGDAQALALRGVAMAQLGELARARELLRRARRAFGPRQAAERARTLLAETEVALALRELAFSPRTLGATGDVLRAAGDHANAAFARVLEVQRLVLSGKLKAAETRLAELEPELGRAS